MAVPGGFEEQYSEYGPRIRRERALMTPERPRQPMPYSLLWIELLGESGTVDPDRMTELRDEANQLTAILVTSAKTLKRRRSGA